MRGLPVRFPLLRFSASLLLATSFGVTAAAAATAPQPSIIPQPKSVVLQTGTVSIASGTPLCIDANNADERFIAGYFSDLVKRTRGITLTVHTGTCTPTTTHPAIVLKLVPDADAASSEEAYGLIVSPHGVTITAGDRAGLFYGGVTLWQLLTQTPARNTPAKLQAMRIDDAPRLAWRGIMLDSARHYQSVAFIEKLIDQMALHKLNVLHWHLVDDQGWRIEIKQYPRLTSVGAFRVPFGPAAAANIDPKTGKPAVYGGFYTQEQARHLVAYAAARNINIVPEIEMPGHSMAAIAAYPELGSSNNPPTSPANKWGISSDIYNVNDSTFTFLQNVLTEVMAIFPSPYIHVGGDEAAKDEWKDNPDIQAKMHALGITNEDALQSYFIQRMEKFLNAHGRRLIGWDEILQGGLAPNATVMSWRGVEGGIAAAKAGHDAVLSPRHPLYFNYRQGDGTDEPPSRAPLSTLNDVYMFEPAPADKLTPDEQKHIIGVQANIFMEYVRTQDRIDHMLFPRAAALAEVGWTPAGERDWQSFLARMVPEFDRYRALGLTAADSAFEVRTTETLDSSAHKVKVALANQVNFGAIHYTLNGTAPTVKSPLYVDPLTLSLPTDLRAGAFADDGHTITPSMDRKLNELSVRRRDSRELTLCSSNTSDIQMEDDAPINGPRAVFLVNYMNPCWIYKAADLNSITSIQVAVGQIPNNLMIGKTVKIVMHPTTMPGGELEVFLNRCTGKPILRMPLEPALHNNALTTLSSAFPAMTGQQDLCFTFTRDNDDFIWAVNSIQLVPAGSP